MMISTRGRYALRILIELAERNTARYTPLKEIAVSQEISEKYLESIVKALVQGGYLTGIRGKHGGYRLNKRPEDCTVGGILRLTEISIAPVSCLDPGSEPCPRADRCRTLPMWCKLNALVSDFLDSISLSDLMNSPEQVL